MDQDSPRSGYPGALAANRISTSNQLCDPDLDTFCLVWHVMRARCGCEFMKLFQSSGNGLGNVGRLIIEVNNYKEIRRISQFAIAHPRIVCAVMLTTARTEFHQLICRKYFLFDVSYDTIFAKKNYNRNIWTGKKH